MPSTPPTDWRAVRHGASPAELRLLSNSHQRADREKSQAKTARDPHWKRKWPRQRVLSLNWQLATRNWQLHVAAFVAMTNIQFRLSTITIPRQRGSRVFPQNSNWCFSKTNNCRTNCRRNIPLSTQQQHRTASQAWHLLSAQRSFRTEPNRSQLPIITDRSMTHILDFIATAQRHTATHTNVDAVQQQQLHCATATLGNAGCLSLMRLMYKLPPGS